MGFSFCGFSFFNHSSQVGPRSDFGFSWENVFNAASKTCTSMWNRMSRSIESASVERRQLKLKQRKASHKRAARGRGLKRAAIRMTRTANLFAPLEAAPTLPYCMEASPEALSACSAPSTLPPHRVRATLHRVRTARHVGGTFLFPILYSFGSGETHLQVPSDLL